MNPIKPGGNTTYLLREELYSLESVTLHKTYNSQLVTWLQHILTLGKQPMLGWHA